ncbi:Uncharacterised protein [Shigella flexneri]|nr:Uncharacterised protein [Shigella flexneri]
MSHFFISHFIVNLFIIRCFNRILQRYVSEFYFFEVICT